MHGFITLQFATLFDVIRHHVATIAYNLQNKAKVIWQKATSLVSENILIVIIVICNLSSFYVLGVWAFVDEMVAIAHIALACRAIRNLGIQKVRNKQIDWFSMVLFLRQHNIGWKADGFYRSDDPTNSVKALKEGG